MPLTVHPYGYCWASDIFPARVNVETTEGDAFERLSTILSELATMGAT